jgi:pyrroloquinoline quinone biosynthesis protein E
VLPAPLALIAEITHRCPLHCVYCSNPLQLTAAASELSTEDWIRVVQQAGKLGVLHLHLSGGEPLARIDLTELVSAAHAAGLYTNLITSGIGLSPSRLDCLVKAGLDHIQLSFQGSRENDADDIAGTRAHALKTELAPLIRKSGVAFTLNFVVHRKNLDHLEEIISFAESLQPDRLEIANVQYYGWGLRNRDALLPTRQQVEDSMRVIAAAEQKLAGRMRIDAVPPDYYARFPKPCMGGWGQRLMLIDPSGQALPCHAAGVIPGLQFDSVREHPLQWIWRESPAFQKFRGETWMPEPCRSCDRRGEDFGGCRCQAFLLTGDATATDPVCSLAPAHQLVDAELLRVNSSTGSTPASLDAPRDQLRESPSKSPDWWSYRPHPG